MTRYAGRLAVVVHATRITLAIAKRLVEGGARVHLVAATVEERAHARAELGSTARVCAAAELVALLRGDPTVGGVDFVFADGVPGARPVLPFLRNGSAVVLTADTSSPACVRALAGELASRGIRVNVVAPGCIEASDGGSSPMPPLGRFGSAEEVARAALFLAAEATFTTGARLLVDGGLGRLRPPSTGLT